MQYSAGFSVSLMVRRLSEAAVDAFEVVPHPWSSALEETRKPNRWRLTQWRKPCGNHDPKQALPLRLKIHCWRWDPTRWLSGALHGLLRKARASTIEWLPNRPSRHDKRSFRVVQFRPALATCLPIEQAAKESYPRCSSGECSHLTICVVRHKF